MKLTVKQIQLNEQVLLTDKVVQLKIYVLKIWPSIGKKIDNFIV